MSYGPINWQNQPSTATPISADNLNHSDTQYTEAVNSVLSERYSPFILSGLVATKDGSVANKLDVTAGVIYLLSTVDATLRRFAPTATSFTTSAVSSTYYLDIYPVAGTVTTAPTFGWSFATSHTANANYYTVATVLTDASGNIKTAGSSPPWPVTDTASVRGAVLEAVPRVALQTGGMLATVYALPNGAAGDIPGAFIGAKVVGPIDWTGFNLAGVTTSMYMRIVGLIKSLYSETYTFYVTSDDGVRLYVGDQELVGDAAWIAQSATTYSSTISLTANMWYPVIIEHFQGGSAEQLKFEWSSTTQTRQDVPAANMMWQWPGAESTVVARYGYFHYNVKIDGNQVWHAGNDGAGSGLDADLIDGRQIFVQTATPTGANEGDIWIKAIRHNINARLTRGEYCRPSAGLLRTPSPIYKLSTGWDGSDQDAW